MLLSLLLHCTIVNVHVHLDLRSSIFKCIESYNEADTLEAGADPGGTPKLHKEEKKQRCMRAHEKTSRSSN